MKTVALLTIVLISAVLMGCSSNPCTTDSCCGNMQANCCGWDFYKPCRMIRGTDSGCPDDCGTRVELTPCETAPAVEATPDGAAPADVMEVEEVTEEAVEPSADLGVAPTGR